MSDIYSKLSNFNFLLVSNMLLDFSYIIVVGCMSVNKDIFICIWKVRDIWTVDYTGSKVFRFIHLKSLVTLIKVWLIGSTSSVQTFNQSTQGVTLSIIVWLYTYFSPIVLLLSF